jgi:hypothetical protein
MYLQDEALLYGVDVSGSKMFQSQRVRAAAAFAAAAHAGQVRLSVLVIAQLHASLKAQPHFARTAAGMHLRGVPHPAAAGVYFNRQYSAIHAPALRTSSCLLCNCERSSVGSKGQHGLQCQGGWHLVVLHAIQCMWCFSCNAFLQPMS